MATIRGGEEAVRQPTPPRPRRDDHAAELSHHPLLPRSRAKHLREVRVVDGRSADTLLEVAREVGADLIVMGAHRHTTVGELVLGSTAHRVAQRAPMLVRLAD